MISKPISWAVLLINYKAVSESVKLLSWKDGLLLLGVDIAYIHFHYLQHAHTPDHGQMMV